ncbi:MAG: hypothetical protein EU539_03375 [Promethearchaeota archaeon]|nr:MAG: hypothetical protein EU539_03375 [Candidatus Lokiarchaeota archaeon]
MSSYVHFENKLPRSRRKKSLISLAIISIITLSTILILIYFPYPKEKKKDSSDDELDFPIISITCYEELDNENYSNCIFELESSESSEEIDPMKARIKIRGETTATYPKKGYRLELSKGEPLLGMRDDDDWQLFASYYDYTRIRFKLSFNLWRNLLSVDNPTAILPKSRYVLLYFNAQFQGLYLLAEKNDRKLFGLNENLNNDTDDSLIFQAKDPSNLTVYEPDKWEQDWPNEDEGYYIIDDVMVNLITFINSSTSDIDFFNETTGIYTKFEEINLIDFFLFNYFILHLDFWNKNYFLIRDNTTVSNPSKFSLIPWDFDLTFGQNISTPEDFENPTLDLESKIREKNLLFDRLLGNQSFRENCSKRWDTLRKEVWTNESISNMIMSIYGECIGYAQLDLNIWDQNYTVDKYITELRQWISDRLSFCDDHFENDF